MDTREEGTLTTVETFAAQAYNHPNVRKSLELLLRLSIIGLIVYMFIPE